jgi:glyceraldehyde-3-phosphate dehydrogenase/erythrose-4-phosphate dehydrogenase
MSVRVAINGFGRIGRNLLRAAKKQGVDLESSPSTTSPTSRRSRCC